MLLLSTRSRVTLYKIELKTDPTVGWFALQEKSDQPEDGPWKGRNMSLREAM